MPWSAKAQELLRGQYAPVGAAATTALDAAAELLSRRPPHAAWTEPLAAAGRGA